MFFSSSKSKLGSSKSIDSMASKKKHVKLSTIRSNGSARSKQSKEERLTDAAAKSNSEIRDDVSVDDDAASKSSSGTSDGVSVDDDAAAKSNSEIRDGAPVDDVSSENPTKLFAFVSKRNWAGVAERCSGADKAEATNWIVEHNNDGSIRWRLLPIHQACENKAPSQVIKMLIAAYPESLMMKDSFGFLPLHLACRERGSKAVIAALLSKEPAAAKIEDAEGRLPLHLACRQGVAVQIVDSLIACHYRAARTPDSYSLIPLHYACAQNSSLAIIESLLRAHPDPADLKDKWGRTPLSLAQASTNPEQDEIIKALLKEPSFWTTSLVNEIDTLKHKLDETAVEEGKFSSQVNELQGENAKLKDLILSLKEKVAIMSNMNIFSGDKLDDENSALVAEVVDVISLDLPSPASTQDGTAKKVPVVGEREGAAKQMHRRVASRGRRNLTNLVKKQGKENRKKEEKKRLKKTMTLTSIFSINDGKDLIDYDKNVHQVFDSQDCLDDLFDDENEEV